MVTNEIIDSFTGEYRFLSNFYPCSVDFRNVVLPSTEHAYVAAKCGIWKKETLLALTYLTAGQIKRYGRDHLMVENWDDMKYSVMETIVSRKFNQNPTLAAMLISTGDALLVEGNTWGDTYWGVCKGVGRNYLGKILMKTRDELNERESSNLGP